MNLPGSSGAYRNPANKWPDFVLGAFGLIGLIVALIRQNDNQISWGHFLAGFATATVLW